MTNRGRVKVIDFGAAVDMCTGINFNPLSGMLDPRCVLAVIVGTQGGSRDRGALADPVPMSTLCLSGPFLLFPTLSPAQEWLLAICQRCCRLPGVQLLASLSSAHLTSEHPGCHTLPSPPMRSQVQPAGGAGDAGEDAAGAPPRPGNPLCALYLAVRPSRSVRQLQVSGAAQLPRGAETLWWEWKHAYAVGFQSVCPSRLHTFEAGSRGAGGMDAVCEHLHHWQTVCQLPVSWVAATLRCSGMARCSAGILLLQLAVPELRSAGAVRNLNIELGNAGYDLDAWRCSLC